MQSRRTGGLDDRIPVTLYLGVYEIDGDPPDQLLGGYDRVDGQDAGSSAQVEFHGCAVREAGITIYVACPTKEAFEGFSSGAEFRAAAEAAGFPSRLGSGCCRCRLCGRCRPRSHLIKAARP